MEAGGCSGFSYKCVFCTSPKPARDHAESLDVTVRHQRLAHIEHACHDCCCALLLKQHSTFCSLCNRSAISSQCKVLTFLIMCTRFELDPGPKEGDAVFAYDGAQLVVDSVSLEFVRGAKVDYAAELIKSNFEVSIHAAQLS